MPRTIVAVEVADIEKRRIPSKHYVYVIYVTWSDKSTNVIYRRYSRFFDFQSKLMDMFPEESGSLDPRKRIIPFLPGKKLLGRSHIREVALKRMKPIGEYCRALLKLPSKISEHKEVIQFFEIDADDINPPKEKKSPVRAEKISPPRTLEHYVATDDYTKQEKGEVNLVAGMVVEIVEKSESGWWFVNAEDEQGWVPSTYLEREDGVKEDTIIKAQPGEEEKYLCTDPFQPTRKDEIAMERGAVVDVIEKNLQGWWLVRYNGKEGYVPATNLVKTETFQAHREKLKRRSEAEGTGIQIIGSLLDVSDLLKKDPVPTKKQEEDDETEAIYEEIKKSRSLKRGGSIKPPPRQSVRVTSINSQPVTAGTRRSSTVKRVYITIADFSDHVGDGISFKAGQEVQVLEKSDSGWWFVKIHEVEGWAPVTYIQETTINVEGSKPWENLKQGRSVSVIQEHYTESDDSDWEDDNLEVEEEERPESKTYQAKDFKSQLAGQNRASDPPTKSSSVPNPPAKQMIAKKVDKEEDAETKTLTEENESLGTTLKHRFERIINNNTNKPDADAKRPAFLPKPGISVSSQDTEEHTKGIGNLQEVLKAKLESRQKHLGKDDSDAGKPDVLPVAKNKVASVALQPPSAVRKPSPQRPSTPPDFSKHGQNSGGRASSPIRKSFSPHHYMDSLHSEIKSETDTQEKLKKRSESLSTIKFEQESNFRQDRLNVKPQPPPSQAKPKLSTKFSDRDSCIQGCGTGHVKSMFEAQGDKNTQVQRGDFPVSITNQLKSRFETQEPKTPVNPDSDIPVAGTRNIKAVFESKEVKKTTGQNADVRTIGTRNIKAMFEQKRDQKPSTTAKPSNVPKPSTVPKPGTNQKPSTVLKPVVLSKVNRTGDNGAVEEIASYRSKLGSNVLPKQTEFSKRSRLESQGSNKQTVPLKSQKSSNIVKPLFLPIKPSASIKNIRENNVSSGMTTIVTAVLEKYIAVASFVAQNEGEVDLVQGDEVQILDKAEGWWYVKNGENEGWAPADFIQEKGSNTENSDHSKQMSNSVKTVSTSNAKQQARYYKATADFVAENDGEVGFLEGEEIDVLDTPDGGWWYVKIRNSEGWAPSSYIMEIL